MLGWAPRMEIQVECEADHHGSEYGGHTICPRGLSSNAVVYSAGVGDDISFDLSLIQNYAAKVYAFDPTPQSFEWISTQRLPAEFHFYNWAISDRDGVAKLFPPRNRKHISHTLLPRNRPDRRPLEVKTRRVETVMKELGHDQVDVLKLDIEGSEYVVIADILSSNLRIEQMIVEFHNPVPQLGRSATKAAIQMLNQHGYRTFHISDSGKDYSFLRQ